MYKRDFGFLLLSVCAVYLSLQDDVGPFVFRKAWLHEFADLDAVGAATGAANLPAPVVADLNGDGKPEIITATPGGSLAVLAPARPGDGFARALVIAELELGPLLGGGAGAAPAHVVALRTGYLTPPPAELVRALRKQVVVLLTSTLQVLCLDHNLRLAWRYDAADRFPKGAVVREAAILVADAALREGDRGVVVVGASATPASAADRMADADVFGEEIEMEGLERRHAGGRGAKDGAGADVGAGDAGRHFSYFAFEGGRGELRWKHEAEDFHRDLGAGEAALSLLSVEHGFHEAAEARAARHFGEASCRDFREAVVAALPHRWYSNADSRLTLAHFEKHRAAHGAQKAQLSKLGAAGGARAAGGRPGAGAAGGARTGSAAARALAEGGAPGRLDRVLEGARYGGSAAGLRRGAAPNVLVAHLEEGLEAVHLASGRTVCRLFLPPRGLHADLDGDGVPDHAVAVGGDPDAAAAAEEPGWGGAHEHGAYCHAAVLSGVPPRHRVFNGTICRPFRGALQRGLHYGPVEVAPPAALPAPGRRGGYRAAAAGQRSLVAFANSRGEVTAYTAGGDRLWQVYAATSWAPARAGLMMRQAADYADPDDDGGADADAKPAFRPTLAAMPLRTHAVPTVLLVAGEDAASVLSEHGHELDSLDLPAPPAQPLVLADFNFDGYTDIVMVSRGALYGWAQVRRPGALPFSALVGGLIVIMVAVFVTQQGFMGPDGKRRGRSTDRVD